MLFNDPILVRITAKGQPLELSLGVQVLSFKYEDVEKGDDLLTILFADPFHKLVDSEQFVENTEWTVQWGFPKGMRPPRKVYVKRPKFRHGEVEVEALDKGADLRLEENWGVVNNKTVNQVVTDIAKKHQLKTEISSDLTNVIGFLAFGGRTDYEVLQYLQSRAANHVFKITSDTLYFKERKLDGPPVGTFEYAPGRDSRLLSFEIKVKDQDNAKAAGQTTASTIDPFTFKKLLFKSDESTTANGNLGNRRPNDKYKAGFTSSIPSVSQLASKGGKFTAPTQGNSTGKSLILPPKSSGELEDIAKSKRRQATLDAVEADFEILASPDDPMYQSGDLISVMNIGKKFSGSYQIVEIVHDLSDGYVYKIKAKRNAVNDTTSSAANGYVNGYVNKKKSKNTKINGFDKKILGSLTNSEYGNAGRKF